MGLLGISAPGFAARATLHGCGQLKFTMVVLMCSGLLDAFAKAHPGECERRGGEVFVTVEAAQQLVDEAEAVGIAVLGLEGFVIGDATYPALSRIADFSAMPEFHESDVVRWSCAEARRLLAGPWSVRPEGLEDQIHSKAEGRHMICLVFQETDRAGFGATFAAGSTRDDAVEPVPLVVVVEALRALEGLTFWDGGRGADMKMFAFGSPRLVPRRNGEVSVGQFALHLQCPWRLTQHGVLITSHEDITLPVSAHSGGASSDSRGGNRCDEAVERLFAASKFSVVGTSCHQLSEVAIACSDGLALQISVDDASTEQWRLFEPAEVPGQGKDHLVVERIDGHLVAAWE